MLNRFKYIILLGMIVILAACATTPVSKPIQVDKPALPDQPQPAVTAAEKVVTLVPESEYTAAPLSTPTPAPVLQPMDEKGQETVTANLRDLLGAPELGLAFKGFERSPNATNHSAALFVDTLGNTYYISQETLQPIEFTLEKPVQAAQAKAKTAEELRARALQYAKDHSPKFATWQDKLTYTEGNKGGENSFFRWEAAGTDVGGMPAIFQVGLKQDGTLFAYLNSLDFLP